MNLGKNEKIFILLKRRYPNLDTNSIRYLMKVILQKNIRIDNILHSLTLKELINPNNGKLEKIVKDLDIKENIPVFKKEVLNNLKYFEKPIAVGKVGKSIMYLLYKTKKSSLKFIVSFFKMPSANIYAILKRLEEKNLVLSYHSRIKHKNSSGKRFSPKYYSLTSLGNVWLEINGSDITTKDKINEFLKKPQDEIMDLITKFENNKT